MYTFPSVSLQNSFYLWGSVKMYLAMVFMYLSYLGFAELLRSEHLHRSPNLKKKKMTIISSNIFLPSSLSPCNPPRITINPTISFDIIP